MPELPDIELYRERIAERAIGQKLVEVKAFSPFVIRSFAPQPTEFAGRTLVDVERLGKRIVLTFEGEYFAVIHLMIAGRLQWQSPLPPVSKAIGKMLLIAFRFDSGQLSLSEVSTRKRASVYFVAGRDGLAAHTRGGVSMLDGNFPEISARIKNSNRTLKRILTDPHMFDAIGNAYSDEILFHAKLSPVRTGASLSDDEIARLHKAAAETLIDWTKRLKEIFPEFPRPAQITAFRPDFAVHGRFGDPCPVCGNPVQRIVFAENETNYCAKCQNEGRLLADRSLSRLLKSDWPKTLEEMLGS